jgi:hypothetical protein
MKRVAVALAGVRRAVGQTRPRRQAPAVVCLCGSTRFKTAFEEANRRETLAGRIVLSVGVFGHCEAAPLRAEIKAVLDELHLSKIDRAEEILVINVNGYVGESTRREIAYAEAQGKRVRYLERATMCRVSPSTDYVIRGATPQPSLA